MNCSSDDVTMSLSMLVPLHSIHDTAKFHPSVSNGNVSIKFLGYNTRDIVHSFAVAESRRAKYLEDPHSCSLVKVRLNLLSLVKCPADYQGFLWENAEKSFHGKYSSSLPLLWSPTTATLCRPPSVPVSVVAPTPTNPPITMPKNNTRKQVMSSIMQVATMPYSKATFTFVSSHCENFISTEFAFSYARLTLTDLPPEIFLDYGQLMVESLINSGESSKSESKGSARNFSLGLQSRSSHMMYLARFSMLPQAKPIPNIKLDASSTGAGERERLRFGPRNITMPT